MGRVNKNSRNELEQFQDEIQRLKSENRNLKKRNKYLERWKHTYTKSVEVEEELDKCQGDCPICLEGDMRHLDMKFVKLLICDVCGHREKLDGEKKTKRSKKFDNSET